MNIENTLILDIFQKDKKIERPPIWIMRQAGRYLPEYQEVRKKSGGFRAMIDNPNFAAEVTIQPVDIIDVDAAIIFSDILVIPEALGLPYEMIKGKGPFFPKTINTITDIDALNEVSVKDSNLQKTIEAIEITKEKLQNRVPLIGFAGAPWTIFAYMIEGQGSKTFSNAKRFLYLFPEESHALLSKITDATVSYLKAQIEAGGNLIQIFDSWAGILPKSLYLEFALPYIEKITDAISTVPKIVFARGAHYAIEEIGKISCDAISLDWTMDPKIVTEIAPNKILQGNMDTCVLYADESEIERETIKMLQDFPERKHIANLGHGLYPDLEVKKVKKFVDTVKNFRY